MQSCKREDPAQSHSLAFENLLEVLEQTTKPHRTVHEPLLLAPAPAYAVPTCPPSKTESPHEALTSFKPSLHGAQHPLHILRAGEGFTQMNLLRTLKLACICSPVIIVFQQEAANHSKALRPGCSSVPEISGAAR